MPASRNGGVIILIILVVIVLYSYNKDNIPSLTRLEQTGTTSQRDLSLRIDNRITDFFEDETFSVVQQESREIGVIIELDSKIAANSVRQGLGDATIFKYSDAVASKISKEELDELTANPAVKSVYLDEEVITQLQESVPLINADDVWDIQVSNTNITGSGAICVVDTGIDYNHTDLKDNYIGGYDIYNNDNDPMDDRGHGTHVAAIAAGNGVLKGVAPAAKIVAVKALNSDGSGSVSTITSAIEWCVANKELYNINVITMSLGSSAGYINYCDDFYPSYKSALGAAINVGIVPVAATGNYGSRLISSPGCMSNTIAVGATDKSDAIASFSDRNSITDILAPGVSICAAQWDNYKEGISECIPDLSGHIAISGTSMATPHIAGSVNLLLQYSSLNNRILTFNETRNILRGSDIWVFDSKSGLNYPRINILRSLFVENGSIITTTSTSTIKTTTTSIPTTSTTIFPPTHSQGPIDGNVFMSDSTSRSRSNVSWLNPVDARFSDDIKVSLSSILSKGSRTDLLAVKDFGFNIPENAIITGIEVLGEGYVVRTTNDPIFYGQGFLVYKNGILVNDADTNGTFLPLYKNTDIPRDGISAGGGKDYLWGKTWTPADINSPDFGVAFEMENQVFGICVDTCTNYNVYVDNIQAKVYYYLSNDSTITSTSTISTTSSTSSVITTSISTTISTILTTISTSIIPTTTSSIPTTSIPASTTSIVTTIPTTIASTTTSIVQIATGNATSQIGGLALSREGQLTTTTQSTTTVQTIGGGTSTATTTSGIQQPIEPEKINPLIIIGIIALIWWLSKKG